MGVEVIRPDIAGLMGAFGAALCGRSKAAPGQTSALLGREALANFSQETESRVCGLCGNNCQLTVNTFAGGETFVSGNRCDRPVTGKAGSGERNLYAYKRKLDFKLQARPRQAGKIGIPLCLNMWELLPFWHTFFTKLGFAVYHSPLSSRDLYLKGQATIPSDTACFPAKLAHGHIQFLSKLGLDAIFYPCMTYNLDEGLGDNHYNCPVVAYYPELLAANVPELKQTRYLYPYFGLHRPKDMERKAGEWFFNEFQIPKRETAAAVKSAYIAYNAYKNDLRNTARTYIDSARAEGRPSWWWPDGPTTWTRRSTTASTT